MEADGEVTVLVGTTELGQGARTAYAQIAAEELSTTPERVTVRGTDTRFTPYDRSTGASRSTTIAGLAVQRAAADVRAKLVEIAGTDELDAATFPQLFIQHFGLAGGELIGRGEVAPQGSGSYAEGPVFWEICIGAAEVEVDPETGRVHVRKTATIADVGVAINPQLVERQDEGGTMQGLGNALLEEMVYQDASLLNPSMLEYRVPNMLDLPDSIGRTSSRTPTAGVELASGVHERHRRGQADRGGVERAKAGVELANGVLERLDAVKADGGGITYESDLESALAGCQIVIEAAPERLDLKKELFAQFEQTRRGRRDPRVEHLRHPDHEHRGRPAAPRARDRHALVEPAPPDPDDRGHPGREDDPGDRRRDRRARQGHRLPRRRRARGAGLRREPHPLRDPARVPRPRRSRASSTPREWTRTCAGASATSSR